MLLSDRVTGTFLAGLGALAYYGGSLLPPVPGQQVGPNVFPMVVGGGLVLCGVAIAAGIGQSFEEAEQLVQAEDGETPVVQQPRWLQALLILVPPLMLLFYAFTVDVLGFVPTAAVMVAVVGLALGGSLKQTAVIALAAPPLVHLIFYKLLRVPLPAGLLPMPW